MVPNDVHFFFRLTLRIHAGTIFLIAPVFFIDVPRLTNWDLNDVNDNVLSIWVSDETCVRGYILTLATCRVQSLSYLARNVHHAVNGDVLTRLATRDARISLNEQRARLRNQALPVHKSCSLRTRWQTDAAAIKQPSWTSSRATLINLNEAVWTSVEALYSVHHLLGKARRNALYPLRGGLIEGAVRRCRKANVVLVVNLRGAERYARRTVNKARTLAYTLLAARVGRARAHAA